MNKTLETRLHDSLVEIIRKTSAELPDDVFEAIEKGREAEQAGSSAAYAMNIICDNVDIAKRKSQPLCQDTGTVLFYIHFPMKTEIILKSSSC